MKTLRRSVLALLVAHPSTAEFVSWKLAQKFVADDPPASLVERIERRWPSARVETKAGAQPLYPYLVGYVPDPKPR